jgi:hypothetical protein
MAQGCSTRWGPSLAEVDSSLPSVARELLDVILMSTYSATEGGAIQRYVSVRIVR